jgi:hypothetical protein
MDFVWTEFGQSALRFGRRKADQSTRGTTTVRGGRERR